MTDRWRYALYGLLSRQQIAHHIPWTWDQPYARMLGEAGTAQVSISLRDPKIQAMRLREQVLPRRTTLVVFRDETVVWEGIVWTRQYKRSDGRMVVQASELRSYLDSHRVLRPEDGPSGDDKVLSFTQVDQLAIFRALLADAQGVTRHGKTPGDIGIEMDTTQMSGVLRDRKDVDDQKGAYYGTEFTPYGQRLDELAQVDGGFEWRIDSYLDSDRQLRRRLVLGYPKVGRDADEGSLVLESPGQISDFDYNEDGESSANYVAAIGSNVTPDPDDPDTEVLVWGESWGDSELDAGYPLLETTTAYSTVQQQTTIDSHAKADLAASLGDTIIPAVTVKGYPAVDPGDYVRLRIYDPPMFGAAPLEQYVRVLGIQATPGPAETTVLVLQEGKERQNSPRDARSGLRWQRDIARRISALEAAR